MIKILLKFSWLIVRVTCLVFAFSTYQVQAESSSHGVFFVEAGVIAPNLGRLSNAPTGETSLFAALSPDLAISAQIPMSARWSLSPIVGYTVLGLKGADVDEKSTLLPAALRLELNLDPLFIHAGPGILIYTISGSGGSVTLNNGTGNAEFGLPSGSQSSSLFVLNVGSGIAVGRLRIGIDALVTNLMSTPRRSVNLMANLGFALF